MKPFLKNNTIALLIAVSLTYLVQNFLAPNLQDWLYLAILFFFSLNLLVVWLFSINKNKARVFVNNVMISSMLRMFTSLGFIIAYLLLTSIIDKASVIFFLFYYLLFTAFEIYYLVYKLRPEKQR